MPTRVLGEMISPFQSPIVDEILTAEHATTPNRPLNQRVWERTKRHKSQIRQPTGW